MAAYRIEIGTMVFENSSIILGSLNISTAVDIAGAELAADIFTVVVDFEAGTYWLFSPSDYDGIMTEDNYLFGTADATSGDLTQTAYGTPILFYRDNVLFSKFFVRSVERVGKTNYAITAMSAVGFLDNQRHYGGVYSGVTVQDLIDEIIGAEFTYSIDAAVQDQYVSGWLPIDTARNNLHKVMFAFGISLTKDANGDIQFVFLSDSSPSSVPNDRIFLGGSVDYSERVTDVEVWEHIFYKLPAESESIYTNNGGITADHLMIEFSEPYYDLTTDDALVINESGDNYAVVTGTGTLYGKKYFHVTNVISQHIADATVVPNVITSSEDALINSLNSRSVLARLVSYYSSKKTVRADILLAGEKAGSVISFEDAFGDSSTGIIAEQDTVASSFLKAACKIITGYTPTGQGNFYANRVLITANGTWTVPQGVTTIRVALIGGGAGGQGGTDGEDGLGEDASYGGYLTRIVNEDNKGYVYSNGNQALPKGGDAGAAGAAGKVYVQDVDIVGGEAVAVVVGSGGIGGAVGGASGTAGSPTTATIFGMTLSSDNGSNAAAFVDVFTGEVYAAPGEAGHAGGDGGQTDTESLYAANGKDGQSGANVGTQTGGAGGAGYDESVEFIGGTRRRRASGGGGGGAAYGASGSDGTAGNWDSSTGLTSGGNGGAGANASPPDTPTYGCGGGGGNGGGGGGNGAGCRIDNYASGWDVSPGNGGAGGTGSRGGHGGAGVCIIYY